jgi:hypothetical protein
MQTPLAAPAQWGWRVHRQLHMSQDFLDDITLSDRRDDPQPALLTHRAACHVNREEALEQSRPAPVGRDSRAFGLVCSLVA